MGKIPKHNVGDLVKHWISGEMLIVTKIIQEEPLDNQYLLVNPKNGKLDDVFEILLDPAGSEK